MYNIILFIQGLLHVRHIRNLLLSDNNFSQQKAEKLNTDQGQTLRKAEVSELL